ncbi:SIR2 family protein, partial [Serratia marcescens]
MRINNYDNLVTSLLNDSRRNKEVSFLFGSAISISTDGKGVPNVNGVIEIIREYLHENNMHHGYDAEVGEKKGSELYQSSFEFLLATGDQNDVQEIMKRAISKARDIESGEWLIPKTILDIAQLVNNKLLKVNNVITTNFDPLIEEALKIGNRVVSRAVVDNDTNIEAVTAYSENQINVIHLHGFWEGDTMHTPNQLLAIRGKVKATIKNILEKSKLYIVGYGGWDDIFTLSLEEIINEVKGNYDIRWAFYEKTDGDINHNNAKLIKTVQPAIAKGRFNAYKDVDCNRLFEDVYNKILSFGNFETEQHDKNKDDSGVVKTMSLEEIYKPKPRSSVVSLKVYNLPYDPSHELIRFSEQISAIKYLEDNGSFILKTGWGFGKLGFIASFIRDSYSESDIFRVDLSSAESKEEVDKKIIDDIGVDLATLFATDELKGSIVIFDNIQKVNADLSSYLSEITSLIGDFPEKIKAIFVTNNTLNIGCNCVELNALGLDEINEYIKTEHSSLLLNGDKVDRLFNITSGLPAKLDKFKSYQSIMSFEDVLDEGYIELSEDLIIENVPNALLVRIQELSISEGYENKKLFSLLKIFSILECGESVNNVRRSFYDHHFSLNDFTRLKDMGLVYSIEKKDRNPIFILKINPVIKDYIHSLLTKEEIKKLTIRSLNIILGDNWRSSNVKINPTSKNMLNYQDCQPGNGHILINSLLLVTISTDDKEEINKIVNTAISYCMFLKSNSFFKELVGFSREIYKSIRNSEIPKKDTIAYYLCESLRMIGSHGEAIEILNPICDHFEKNENYEKLLYRNMLSTLSLSLSSQKDDSAYTYAEKLKEISPANSSDMFLSDSILAKKSTGDVLIRKLKRIEKSARNNKQTLTANNISLELASLLPSNKDAYIDTVLKTERDTYTRIRALLIKAKGILKSDEEEFLHSNILPSVVESYSYLFMQRIDGLFSQCHEILWQVFYKYGDFSKLYNLYKTSSIIWRIKGDYKKEFEYASILKGMAIDVRYSHTEYAIFI